MAYLVNFTPHAERDLAQLYGQKNAEYSDAALEWYLIGGTSTGAILAAGLCLGLKAEHLRDFYLDYGQRDFHQGFPARALLAQLPEWPARKALEGCFRRRHHLGKRKTAHPPPHRFQEKYRPLELLVKNQVVPRTGFSVITVPACKVEDYNLLDWARYSVKELLADANLQQNVLMHLIGQSPRGKDPTPVAEIAAARASGIPEPDALDFMSSGLGFSKVLTYQRITISLTRERLDGLNLPDIDPKKVREMDATDQIGNLQRIGKAVANEQVRMDLLKQFFV
jgi:hypothetical protein